MIFFNSKTCRSLMKTIIDKSLHDTALKSLKKLGHTGTLSKKLQAIISSYKNGISKTSEVLGVSKTSIYLWSKLLSEGNLEGMVNKSKHQEGIKLKNSHKDLIVSWLQGSPNLTIKEVQESLEKECGLKVSKSTVHRAMQGAGFSYITPRKKHYKQNKAQVESFKKKSTKSNS